MMRKKPDDDARQPDDVAQRPTMMPDSAARRVGSPPRQALPLAAHGPEREAGDRPALLVYDTKGKLCHLLASRYNILASR
jgi:hypothetical protein